MPVILGLDVGDVRIGVAISDELGIAAHRLCTVERKDLESDINEIKQIIKQKKADKVVVGIPRRLSGEVGIQAEKVQEFVKYLKDNIEIPVDTWDERLTTVEAEKILISMDVSRRKRKEVIDQVAAALILESYLESKR